MLQAFQSNCCHKLLATLTKHIPAFARESKFIQRTSKSFCPEKFLLALLTAVTNGKGTLHQIAVQLALITDSISISPQAIHERLHRTLHGAETFLVQCLSYIATQKFLTHKMPASPFTRILVEDSTQLALHAHNAEELPGHGNHLGSTAGCKIDLCFDLLTGQTLINELHIATTQDKALGYELLEHLQANDLVLRDMGYFALAAFAHIEEKKAYWLSRLPRNVQAYDLEGTALEPVLQKAKSDTLDIPIQLGKNTRHRARLVAKKCSTQESRENRRSLRARYQARGKTPTKAQLTRCDWHLMASNVETAKQNSQELYELYRQRWQIELAFRGWKKSHQLKELHKHRTSSTHLKVLILAAMIVLSLTLRIAREKQQAMSREKQQNFSMEKLMECISQVIPKLRNLREMITQNIDERHIRGQKRLRKSLINQQYTALA